MTCRRLAAAAAAALCLLAQCCGAFAPSCRISPPAVQTAPSLGRRRPSVQASASGRSSGTTRSTRISCCSYSHARQSPLFASEASSGNADTGADDGDDDEAVPVEAEVEVGGGKKGFLARIKASMKSQEDDGLTFKQRLAKMGLSALLSYGFVSNMSYSVTVSLAWFGFSKKTGLSPLAPGQWKPFLAVYAGFYIFNNVVRPIRLAVSVGVTPYFDRAVAAVQRKTKLNKSASIGVVVFLANFCGTLTAMSLGILMASIAAGVPVFPPKA
eukprot:CAMPEP_0181073400 /NCGR_PEP_ID=MMETSP1070-20121207/29059_1 /TAXON_ID=265543 /ORGANISM="Minutocellus polymorphus, Strain NH13" /LENGTH=269 /DNA_ID=CAMNT_0023154469 /DNA_START=92 /DNA_END=901 /DNA_ORIENTATION=-